MFWGDDMFRPDAFGWASFQRETGFYPGLGDRVDESRVVFLTESVQQDTSAFQAERLVDDVPLCQVVKEAWQEIAVMQDKLSGHFLPGGGVVVSVQ